MSRRALISLVWCAAAWSHSLVRAFMGAGTQISVARALLSTVVIFATAYAVTSRVEESIRRRPYNVAVPLMMVASLLGVAILCGCFALSTWSGELRDLGGLLIVPAGWLGLGVQLAIPLGWPHLLAASFASVWLLKREARPERNDGHNLSSATSPEPPAG